MAVLERSLWDDAVRERKTRRPLPREVDVAVIGAGITGLTTAYLLKRSGRTVAVFERERVGSGESSRTSAHLTYVTDQSLTTLAKRFGRDAARLVWQGGAVAIDLIDTNATEQAMSCQFRRVPGFHCARFTNGSRGDDARMLAEEGALAKELGFAAWYLDSGPIGGGPAVAFADQALFHPVEYLNGLARAIEGDGSHVYERSEVGHVIQDPLAIVVNAETVACKDVVIATHVPLQGSTGTASALMFQTKLYPYSTYVLGARVGDDAPAPGLYSDVSDPYWYLRIHEDGDGLYAIFGGADHKTGQDRATESHFAAVEQVLRLLMPSARIERRWTGQVIETNDGLPYIGATEDHQYVATGYAGNGLTFGTLAGIIVHDAIMGVDNPWRSIFDPNRKSLAPGALARFVEENIDYPFYFVADRLRRHGAGGVGAIEPGGGRVLTIGGRPVACHRTRAGALIKLSAVCTHLGCLVRWNAADSTWDCPCHGSRFTPEGLVLGGPAETPLERITD